MRAIAGTFLKLMMNLEADYLQFRDGGLMCVNP
jgi:hypothetical protein